MGDRAVFRRVGAAFLIVAFVAGCTSPPKEPAVVTAGLLDAADLGTGWDGPFAELQDSDASARTTTCGPLGSAWLDAGRDVEISRSATWVNDEVAVRTFADRYADGSSAVEDRMTEVALVDMCVQGEREGDTRSNIVSFGVEHEGGAIVTREQNTRGDAQWVLETAITDHDDTVVGVEVSYPEGTPDVPDVRELLGKAVGAASELTSSS